MYRKEKKGWAWEEMSIRELWDKIKWLNIHSVGV